MQILELEPRGDNSDAYAEAARVIGAGGLVAFPTETVYGLGANVFDEHAVRRIFAAKGRPPDDPLIVHVRPRWDLTRIADDVPPLAERLMKELWPGPLTVVMPRAASLPAIVTSGLPDVAIRAPHHWVAEALLDACGTPLAAPSANRFSYVSATTAQHVVDDLGDSVDLVLDGGPSSAGIESTVVKLEGNDLVVLRHGALSVDEIVSAVPEIADVRAAALDADAAASPGRMLKHYSPATPTMALGAGDDPSRYELPDRVCVLSYTGRFADDLPAGWSLEVLGDRSELDQVARDLYAKLRSCDRSGHDLLVVELTGSAGIGAALDDRIRRAASGAVLG